MEKLRDWIKKNWLSAATIIVGFLITVFAVGRTCKVEDKYSKLKGVYQAYRTINSAANTQLKEVIAVKQKKIVQLDRQIAGLNTDVNRLRLSLGIKDKALADLEALYPTLTDCATQLVNMTEQRDLWKNKFNLADVIISNQEQTITLLVLKCDELLGIAASFEKQYENELAIRISAENALRACDRKLRSVAFWSKSKNVLIGVAAGYLIYRAVKK